MRCLVSQQIINAEAIEPTTLRRLKNERDTQHTHNSTNSNNLGLLVGNIRKRVYDLICLDCDRNTPAQKIK